MAGSPPRSQASRSWLGAQQGFNGQMSKTTDIATYVHVQIYICNQREIYIHKCIHIQIHITHLAHAGAGHRLPACVFEIRDL